MNKYVRWVLLGIGGFLALLIVSWTYTNLQLAHYSAEGLYATPEQGMLALIDRYYPPERTVEMVYAGPNAPDGSKPFIWYVIAEVYASVRADGSSIGENGCDAPGSYFLQTQAGWVHVPEQVYPEIIGFWMDIFGLAGSGTPTPSTNWAPGHEGKFCQ